MDIFNSKDGTMTLRCSSIRELKGNKTFLVNVFYTTGGHDGKYCGIQIPQYHTAYNQGFTIDEINMIKDHLYDNEDALWEEASMTPPPDDDAIDNFDYIP